MPKNQTHAGHLLLCFPFTKITKRRIVFLAKKGSSILGAVFVEANVSNICLIVAFTFFAAHFVADFYRWFNFTAHSLAHFFFSNTIFIWFDQNSRRNWHQWQMNFCALNIRRLMSVCWTLDNTQHTCCWTACRYTNWQRSILTTLNDVFALIMPSALNVYSTIIGIYPSLSPIFCYLLAFSLSLFVYFLPHFI